MVALKTERQVFLWHVKPTPIPRKIAKSVELGEILEILEDQYRANRASIFLSEGGRVLDPNNEDDRVDIDDKNQIYIADMQRSEDGNYFTILINRGDPQRVNPALIDTDSRDVVIVEPNESEVPGASAHLVIGINSLSSSNSYRAIFERMPSVSSTYADLLLKHILARYASKSDHYLYDQPVKKGKKTIIEKRRYIPRLNIEKNPSDNLKADLEKGVLSSITLIRQQSKFSGIDTEGLVQRMEDYVEIKTKPVSRETILDFIPRISRRAIDEGYTEIKFNIRDLPGGASVSPRFSLDVADAAETLYVRSQRMTGFSRFLEGCYATIDSEIEEKMKGIIDNDVMW